eukprot:Opistho-1_new@40266
MSPSANGTNDVPVDIAALERELERAMDLDARKRRENDAKMRAVQQRVASYDDFKGMVAAAHISPLSKEEIAAKPKQATWNAAARSSGEDGSSHASGATTAGGLPVVEFERDWRRLKTSTEKFEYVSSMPDELLSRAFKEVGGILGSLVAVLAEHVTADTAERVLRVLECASAAQRFALAVKFFSKGEKEQCAALFTRLLELLPVRAGDVERLRALYGAA